MIDSRRSLAAHKLRAAANAIECHGLEAALRDVACSEAAITEIEAIQAGGEFETRLIKRLRVVADGA